MLSKIMGKTQKTKDKEQRINQSWEQSGKDQKVWEERRVVIEKAAAEAKAKAAAEAKAKAESDAKEKAALEAKKKAALEAKEKAVSDDILKAHIGALSELELLWQWNIEYLILEILGHEPTERDLRMDKGKPIFPGRGRPHNKPFAIEQNAVPHWRIPFIEYIDMKQRVRENPGLYKQHESYGVIEWHKRRFPGAKDAGHMLPQELKDILRFPLLIKAEKKLADIQAKKAALIKSLEGNNTTTSPRGGRTKKRRFRHPKKGRKSRTHKRR